MHVPPIFRTEEAEALWQITQQSRLAQFVTATEQGPIVTPLPLFLDVVDRRAKLTPFEG